MIKMKLNKIFSVMLAILLIASLSACGKSSEETAESTETYNFDAQEKTYGDVVHEDDQNYALPMIYDSRFVTEEMAETVANYFYAVQTKDKDLLATATLDFYQTYLIEEVYADDGYDEQGFVDALYNGIKNQTGSNFSIDSIEITDYFDEEESGVESLYEVLDELAGEDDYCENNVEEGLGLTLSFTVTADNSDEEETYTKTDQQIYLIKVEGKYCVITA